MNIKYFKLCIQIILIFLLATACYHQIHMTRNIYFQTLLLLSILLIGIFLDVSIAILCACYFIISLIQLRKIKIPSPSKVSATTNIVSRYQAFPASERKFDNHQN